MVRIKQAGAAVPEDVLAPFERIAEKDLSAIKELTNLPRPCPSPM